MKSLSKSDQQEKQKLINDLQEKRAALEEAISAFNKEATKLFDEIIAPALEEYNKSVNNAADFADNIASEAEAYFDAKSEKWQEGDTGQGYQSFVDAWKEIASNLEEIEVDEFSELDTPNLDDDEVLENGPDSPE